MQTVTVLKRNGSDLAPPEETRYTYDAVGNRETVTLPNGVVTTCRYDSLNRLTNLTHQAGTTNLASYTYQLHPTGRRTNAVEIIRRPDADGGGYLTNTLTWQYDGMYRLTNELSSCSLTNASGRYTNSYAYDKAGNRLAKLRRVGSQTENTTSFYDANDRLLREEITALNGTHSTNWYAYDDNGSLTGKTNSAGGTVLYAYNLANKLSSVTANGQTISFLYNDQGIRVRSSDSYGNQTRYLVDANNPTGYAQILEEFTVTGGTPTLALSYVIGDDVLGQCGAASQSAPSWLLYDGHGSTRQLVTDPTNVRNHYNYDAYGLTLDTSSAAKDTTLGYCGEQFDEILQMYNLRARYYNPGTGRFKQRDTFVGDAFDPQSMHKYIYSKCEPVNGIDPAGGFTLVENLCIAGIAGLAFAFVLPAINSAWQNSQLKTELIGMLSQMSMAGDVSLLPREGEIEAISCCATYAAILLARIAELLKAVRAAVNQAVKLGRQTFQQLLRLPKYLIVKSLGPTIFQFDVMCLEMRPSWFVLTYTGPRSPIVAATRRSMKAAYPEVWLNRPPGYTVDEFPYATTVEGGFAGGAMLQYAPTSPIAENGVQGLTLSAFYRCSRLRGRAGPFLVVPVPL